MAQHSRWKNMKVTLTLATAMLGLMPLTAAAAEENSFQKLDHDAVLELLSQYHVSGTSKEALQSLSVQGMLDYLQDPYTDYFTPDQLKQFNDYLERSYVGIGAVIGVDDAGVYIREVVPGSPAEAAGLQPDDYIQAVDGKPASKTSTQAVVDSILGKEGTKVNITVLRGSSTLDFTLTRKQIQLPVVTSHLFDQGVGYIRVTDFSSDAGDKFAARLAELKNKGMRSLVIDLRNNPGGLLTSAQKIAEQFIKEGVLIHTKDRNNADDPVYIENGSTLNVPVTILVNENSASASEVLTGALRDYGIAKVVGMKSFGKGSVQQIVSLPSGGALKITVQEYLTPNMHKVNKVGLTPDIPADGEAAQMITALRTAGLKDIQLKADKHRLKINNVLVEDGFKTLREHGHVYVPSRAVAALLDGTITWDDKARAVQITAHGNSAAYPAGSEDLILQDGYSYVSLDAFTAKFPELHWTDANGKLVIDTEKGK